MTSSLHLSASLSTLTTTTAEQQQQTDDDGDVAMMETITQDMKTEETDPSSTTTNNKKKQFRKSVRWNEDVTMRLSLHVNQYTDDEVFDTWYQPYEFNQMRRSAIKEQCPIRLKTKIMVRRAVTDALLNEQYRQYYERQEQEQQQHDEQQEENDEHYYTSRRNGKARICNDDDVLALASVCHMASVRAHREARKACATKALLENGSSRNGSKVVG